MKILLDIDGVMVTTPSWKRLEILEDGFSSFNNNAALNLQKIITTTGATIMLTTSHKSNFSIPQWISIFQKRGILINTIDRLPENNHLNRKEEILNWLKNSTENNFIIIDDDKSLNDLPTKYKSKLILTGSLIGLDEEKCNAAINILTSAMI